MFKNDAGHTPLSRREFLKLGGMGLLGAFLPPLKGKLKIEGPPYGRVVVSIATLYDVPSTSGRVVATYWKDSILPITETVIGDPEPAFNQAWYLIGEIGYIHSMNVQPVDVQYHREKEDIPKKGALGQITVPFLDARKQPGWGSELDYRYYYGSNHWVDSLVRDYSGYPFYKVFDDLLESYRYVPARYMRIYPEEELAPISPDVPPGDKRMVVHMGEQMLMAYEDSEVVFVAQISTGDEEASPEYRTPKGVYKTFWKKGSRHMRSVSPARFGEYDLPGVPWVCYFTWEGHALHGVYWHNNFGRPSSHGCVNLKPADAKWLFRWTVPSLPAHLNERMTKNYGTEIEIV
jgi:lipoprotein-anchoring transpeptidase ErfK/SrfK